RRRWEFRCGSRCWRIRLRYPRRCPGAGAHAAAVPGADQSGVRTGRPGTGRVPRGLPERSRLSGGGRPSARGAADGAGRVRPVLRRGLHRLAGADRAALDGSPGRRPLPRPGRTALAGLAAGAGGTLVAAGARGGGPGAGVRTALAACRGRPTRRTDAARRAVTVRRGALATATDCDRRPRAFLPAKRRARGALAHSPGGTRGKSGCARPTAPATLAACPRPELLSRGPAFTPPVCPLASSERHPMITVRDVDVRVGARLLLSGVSFHVSPGDRVGLVGRNGAGKTTLMNVLAGTLRPASGTVTTHGGIGHLPQDS